MITIHAFEHTQQPQLAIYDQIPMVVDVRSEYKLEKIQAGLGGIRLVETPVDPYLKDLGQYAKMTELAQQFDLSHWGFWLAYDAQTPVGGAAVLCKSPQIQMLAGREDLGVLWDIRVADSHQGQGVGQLLFAEVKIWCQARGLKQLKIECQNNNIAACKFYHKQGAVLGEINSYAYYLDPDCAHETQLIWYLDLTNGLEKAPLDRNAGPGLRG
jgi:GNAT superfamily N-acetyltransferase